MNKKQREKRETPIIDGDARPDIPHEEDIKKETQKRTPANDKSKFESERSSDLNSLEDYKDAK
jgi:hypothetical protein